MSTRSLDPAKDKCNIEEYFRICALVAEANSPLIPKDLTFLTQMRDSLNNKTTPVTGRTIAFTILASRDATENISPEPREDASTAFPWLTDEAKKLRSAIAGWRAWAWLLGGVIAILAAYVHWGTASLKTLAEFKAQTETVEHSILAIQIGRLNQSEHPVRSPTTRDMCPNETVRFDVAWNQGNFSIAAQDQDPNVRQLCTQREDLDNKRNHATCDMRKWVTFSPLRVYP